MIAFILLGAALAGGPSFGSTDQLPARTPIAALAGLQEVFDQPAQKQEETAPKKSNGSFLMGGVEAFAKKTYTLDPKDIIMDPAAVTLEKTGIRETDYSPILGVFLGLNPKKRWIPYPFLEYQFNGTSNNLGSKGVAYQLQGWPSRDYTKVHFIDRTYRDSFLAGARLGFTRSLSLLGRFGFSRYDQWETPAGGHEWILNSPFERQTITLPGREKTTGNWAKTASLGLRHSVVRFGQRGHLGLSADAGIYDLSRIVTLQDAYFTVGLEIAIK
ncbi:MAG: hypothetical protein HY401_05570 [Elusimicrobia bacterium]|nr:hypothetical protein [Elusimicrobiota bacterium]